MQVQKFVKKVDLIEAVQFTGSNGQEIVDWIKSRNDDVEVALMNEGGVDSHIRIAIRWVWGEEIVLFGDWVYAWASDNYVKTMPDGEFRAYYQAIDTVAKDPDGGAE